MAASPPLPPDEGRLLSDWGTRRSRRSGVERMHAGMDLGHPGGVGVPILNVENGVVERVLRDADRGRAFSGYGNAVVVHHPASDTWALYAHMNTVDVAPGQTVVPGTRLGTMGASTNRKFPGMPPHLHIELRRRRASGESPFPGPYPRSVQQPLNSLDPRPWLEQKGLRFLGRGGFEIVPGSEMSQTAHLFQGPGVSGYRALGRIVGGTALGLGSQETENEYEPVRFDRDVYFGLTPVEWAAGGATLILATGGAVALWVRSSLARRRTVVAPKPVAANRRAMRGRRKR